MLHIRNLYTEQKIRCFEIEVQEMPNGYQWKRRGH
jgi:hypothetical protein